MNKITKAHFALYQYMKETHENDRQFHKEDMLKIYNQFVVPNKRPTDPERLTEDQIYNNASTWLSRAISALVRHGYFGLTFKENIEPLEIEDKKELICEMA